MDATATQIEVTIDNFTDLFAGDYAYSLAEHLSLDEDGDPYIPNESPLVSTLIGWIEKHNTESREYVINRVTAAMILDQFRRDRI